MTISSSLNAGVAGLSANANRLATISDNIANSATYGYKRSTSDFQSMVLNGNSKANYTAGGVRATNMRLIDESGPLITSANSTDLAVDGRGFLAVTNVSALEGNDPTLPISLVTTGSFRPDADGVLRTSTGQVLMGWPANVDGTRSIFPRDTMASLVPVRLSQNQFVGNPTTEMTLGVNLPALSTVSGASGTENNLAVEYFGNLGTSEALSVSFVPTVPATGSSNSWTMEIRDSASANALVGSYTLNFNPAQVGGGTLTSATTLTGGGYDPTTGIILVDVAGGQIKVNVGKPGQLDGMTQLSSSFTPVSLGKNGSPVASMTSVEVDEKGDLYAIYDQGFTRRLYQIPVIDVPNPNGLTAMNNQAYQVSVASGPIYLWDSGDGPTGTVLGFTREESAVDVAQELTQLIQTQRAYSSNAKVIQTVDEMLQETNGIKR